MLRIYFLQHWFNLSDLGAEDALYESHVLCSFAGVDLGRAAARDETTILNFRHLLEKHELCGQMLDTVNLYLARKGNQWYFGIKAHIGVDSKESIVHSVCTSAASVANKHMLPDLLHGEERKVWGDGGYQGQTEAIHAAAPNA